MKRYVVIGPEYGTVEPILDDGTGPMEYGCDVVEVEAETRRAALVLGVRLLRRLPRGYLDRFPDENPFTGVRVELADLGEALAEWDRRQRNDDMAGQLY